MIIRRLTVFERDLASNFYVGLSMDDRRKRFCVTQSDASIVKYVDGLDFARHAILGAFDNDAELIGLAELAPGDEASEMAFSVRPDMRCQSIGTTLMTRLLRYARTCGIGKVFVMFLPDNAPMRKLAMRAGMRVETRDGESQAVRELPAPKVEELARWFADEAVAHNGYFSLLGIGRWTRLLQLPESIARNIGNTLNVLAT